MSIDFEVVLAQPFLIGAVVLGFLLIKAVALWGMARLMPIPQLERPVFIILLAQGGEFGFVVFQTATQAGVITGQVSSFLIAAVAISMLLTPLLLVAADKWWIPFLAGGRRPTGGLELKEPQHAPVIIAGFGRYGQIVGRMLFANGVTPTVLDHDAEAIEALRKFGWRVFYGDATRLDLMRTAGAADARVIVVAIDDVEQSVDCAKMIRTNFPDAIVVARARNVQHYYELYELGVTLIERETLDSALMSARSVLEQMGWQPHQARNLALRFRRHNVAQLAAIAPHRKDEARLIAAAKQGRQQLEELFAIERQQAARAQGARRLERDRAGAVASSERPTGASFQAARFLEGQARAARVDLGRVAWPMLQRKLVLTVVPLQKAASILSWSKPLIGPQPRPSARAARIR